MKYIATLYDKTGKNKLGELTEILAGNHYVEEERNGVFELSFDYPNGYPLADLLIDENMVEVKPNDTQDLQKFRIYDTKCLMKDIITIFARHESFDLVNDHVENINLENASCEYALNTLFRNSHFSKHYRGYSDIVAAQNYSIDNVNILNAIAGKEGSIIDTYGTGAEILRDGTNIHVLNKRGHDNEVIIEFGKNLTDFVLERDLTDLETRVGGFAKYTIEDNKEVVVKSNWIDSPYIDNFAHPYISIEGRRDYSDKFKEGEIPTVEKLDKLCADEFKINKRDIPKSNYTIKFIPLSKCVGYEGVEDEISLCDTVTIIDPRFNINTKAKVISYKYDFIKERYISMELGEPRTTLGDIIGSGSGDSQVGPQGPPGPPGADGSIGDFPNSLPQTPTLTSKVYGFATIELSWTFEDKVYYTYELYASKTKDFTPNAFDLIHAGQSSSFLFQAKPNETWYFRVCAKNTHGERTEFSPQVVATTKKIDDLSNYVDNMAIGEALIGTLSLDRGWIGKLNANYLDVKGNFSVTDGNGKRTFDIDSFGNVMADVSRLSIRSVGVPTYNEVIPPGNAIADINVTPGNVRILANKIDLQGAVSAGGIAQGNYVYIAQENYNVYRENINTMTIGTVNKEGNIVPAVFMGANGHSGGANYGALFHMGNRQVLSHYNSGRKDWSEISLYSDGRCEVSPAGGLILAPGAGIGLNAHMFPHNQATIFLGTVGNPFSDMATKSLSLPFDGVNHGSVYGRDGRVTIEAKEGHDIYLTTAYDAVKVDKDNGHLMPTKYNRQRLGGWDADSRWTTVCLLSNPDVSSDISLKENIEYIPNTISAKNLKMDNKDVVTLDDMYAFMKDEYKLAKYNYKGFKKNTLGFIAQDLIDTKLGSMMIHENDDGKLSYDSGYRQSIAEGALMKAIDKIELLESKLKQLEEVCKCLQ